MNYLWSVIGIQNFAEPRWDHASTNLWASTLSKFHMLVVSNPSQTYADQLEAIIIIIIINKPYIPYY